MEQQTATPKPAITKAISVKGSILTVIPKPFLKELGIDSDTYLEHTLTPNGMLTRVVRLPLANETSQSSE
jgi:hypothetical protein